MDEDVHFIPVGFDYDRLLYPISKGELPADRVIFFDEKLDEENTATELARSMVSRLRDYFEPSNITTNTKYISDLYQYEDIYPRAHRLISNEIRNDNEVYINISSMPRTVAFAFATAAHTYVTSNPGTRDKVHTYYVAPEEYLITELKEEIEEEVEFLRQESPEGADYESRITELTNLVEKMERKGASAGVKQIDDQLHVEFPAPPIGNLREIEMQILRFLYDQGEPATSTTQLAEDLASEIGEDPGDSFRSKIQYNVSSLEDKGYIDRTQQGRRYETDLSVMGKMWVETRNDPGVE